MSTSQKENYIKGMIFIIISAFCFASMNVCVKLSGDLPFMQKSFFRNFVAAIFASVVIFKNHISLSINKECRLPLFIRCLFGSFGILGNFYAIDHLFVADASILNKLSPFFAIIFSFLFLKEKIKPFQAGCVILAFIGCLFVVKPGFHNAAFFPALCGVFGGMSAGLAYTMVRYMGTHGVKGPAIVFYFSIFSCLMLAPWLILNFHPMSNFQLLALLGAGLSAAGGQFTITAAYTYAPAGKISIYDYSQILFATTMGFFIFGEIPDAYSFVGYGLIIAASFIMFIYNSKRA